MQASRWQGTDLPGSALAPGWVETLQGDDEIQSQVGLHIVVRLAATCGSNHISSQCNQVAGCIRLVGLCASGFVKRIARRVTNAAAAARVAQRVRMGRQLRLAQGNGFRADGLPQAAVSQTRAAPWVHWRAPLQIG